MVLGLVVEVGPERWSAVTKTVPRRSVIAQLSVSTPHTQASHWALSATRYGIIVVRYAKSPRRRQTRR